jgi:AMP deaminase
VINDTEQSKYQNVEWRLSIYGRNINEWDKLAKWVVNHKLFSHNLRWLIQIPRLYEVFKGSKQIENFGDIIRSKSWPIAPLSLNCSEGIARYQMFSSLCSR